MVTRSCRILLTLLSVVGMTIVLNAQAPIYTVDLLATPSTTTFNSLRAALQSHSALYFGQQQTIRVVGRRNSSGTTIPYDDSIEQWSTQGPIVIPTFVTIQWDVALSDPLPDTTKAPAVFSGGNLIGATTAFLMTPNGLHTRANTTLQGLQIVGFGTAISWSPTLGSVVIGATFRSLVINQCFTGIALLNSSACTMNPLITSCTFSNVVQPPLVGGDRLTGPVGIGTHININVDNGGAVTGTVTGCTFSCPSTNAIGSPLTGFSGIAITLLFSGTVSTDINECAFLGSADTALGVPNGLAYGVWADLFGMSIVANFVIRNCWFDKCGSDGVMIFAGGQVDGTDFDSATDWFLASPVFVPPTNFLLPQVLRSSFDDCGRVAAALNGPAEDGHAISTRTYGYGQLQLFVSACNTNGTSAGRANIGIRNSGRDGVYAQSTFYLTTGIIPWSRNIMALTKNDTWVERSNIYNNDRYGVGILLLDGSGNPGVKGNRIYDNEVNGVDVRCDSTTSSDPTNFRTGATTADDPILADLVIAQPVVWNNFIYSLTNPVAQQIGIRTRLKAENAVNPTNPTQIPDVRGHIGVYHNSIVNQGVSAVKATDQIPAGASNIETFVFGNIGLSSGTLDFDLLIPTAQYNCAGHVIFGTGNTTVPPIFANAALGNLHILPNSPSCIDQVPVMVPIGNLIDDFDLQLRPVNPTTPFGPPNNDIGADEL